MRRIAVAVITICTMLLFMPRTQAATPHDSWRDQSIYFLMIDRFHNGDRGNDFLVQTGDPRGWHGGDIKGVIQQLDYIKSLGFTTVWITPHLKNTGKDYHGYGAVDFFDVDPHFGTLDDMKRLVAEAHDREMRVLFDIVVNHTGPTHPLVKEHPDWFHPRMEIKDWNNTAQVQNGWIFNLPDFDQAKPEVREYILSYSKYWIEQTDVDGFRIDTVKHVPADFFAWYAAELEKIKPGFWLIGEAWTNSPTQIAQYQKAAIPALLDFPVSEIARKAFAKDGPMTSVAAMTQRMESTMPNPAMTGAFLDNHDMKRFMTEAADHKVERLKLGLTWLFTQRAIPILYTGTEVGMQGGDDPYNRADFPWGREENLDVRDLVTKLNEIRHGSTALRHGRTENLMADQYRYAFARVTPTDGAIVVINNHGTERLATQLDVTKSGLPDGMPIADALTGAEFAVTAGHITIDVAPRSSLILVRHVEPAGYLALWSALGALGAGVIATFAQRRRRRY